MHGAQEPGSPGEDLQVGRAPEAGRAEPRSVAWMCAEG